MGDRLHCLFHARALRVGGDAEHVRVGCELTRPATQHHAPAREVVEEHHAIGEHERVVIGERADAGAEPDVLRALGRHSDEHLGRRDDLEAGRVVLSDPDLVETQAVESDDEIEISFQREGRVLADGMERGHEVSKTHAVILSLR